MTIFELGALGEFAGAILLFASLVYVGLQIRQNTAATRAQIFQSRTDAFQNYAIYVSNTPEFYEIMRKLGALDNPGGDPNKISDLTDLERFRYFWVNLANRQRSDNMYYQYTNGFLDEEFYDSNGRFVIRSQAPMWKALGLGGGGRPSFNAEIERILSENK